jgi:hypothetical protein
MKRSEMIKAIKARLDVTPIQGDYADQFLTVVELLGMLPPSDDLNTGAWDIPVPTWEPEEDDSDDDDKYCGAV